MILHIKFSLLVLRCTIQCVKTAVQMLLWLQREILPFFAPCLTISISSFISMASQRLLCVGTEKLEMSFVHLIKSWIN